MQESQLPTATFSFAHHLPHQPCKQTPADGAWQSYGEGGYRLSFVVYLKQRDERRPENDGRLNLSLVFHRAGGWSAVVLSREV